MLVDFAGAAFYHAVALEHANERTKETLAVEKEALALYVFAVEGRLHGDFEFVATVDLRPTGQAHRHVVGTILVAFFNQVVLVPQRRTRANDAHGPFENVEHLRKFIEAGLAQEPAHLGNPLLGVAQFVRRGVLGGVGAHGAELVDVKVLFVQAHAFLLEEHGALAVELDGDGNGEHREREHHDAETGEHNIDKAFYKELIHQLDLDKNRITGDFGRRRDNSTRLHNGIAIYMAVVADGCVMADNSPARHESRSSKHDIGLNHG